MRKIKSLRLLAIAGIISFGFHQCTNDEEIFSGFPIVWEYESLQAVHDAMNLTDTVVLTIVDPTISNTLNGPKGTQFVFPENSIKLNNGGEALPPFTFQLLEIYKRGDMIRHNVQTFQGANPLVSTGAIWLVGTDANGDALAFNEVQTIFPYKTDANAYQEKMKHYTGEIQMAPSGAIHSWTGGQTEVVYTAESDTFTLSNTKPEWNQSAAPYELGEDATQFKVRIGSTTDFAMAQAFFASNDLTTVAALTSVEQDALATPTKSIPMGTQGKIVAIALIEGKLHFGTQEVTVNGDDEFNVAVNPGTLDELIILLNAMN